MLGLLSGISIACCLILFNLPIPLDVTLATIALIIISTLYFIFCDALLMLPWSWQMLDVDTKGKLTITNRRGQQFQPELNANTFIHEKMIILNFKRRRLQLALPPVILFTIAENANELRRLRVWLRWFKRDDANQDDLSDAELEA
jgi:hypothetical protein